MMMKKKKKREGGVKSPKWVSHAMQIRMNYWSRSQNEKERQGAY